MGLIGLGGVYYNPQAIAYVSKWEPAQGGRCHIRMMGTTEVDCINSLPEKAHRDFLLLLDRALDAPTAAVEGLVTAVDDVPAAIREGQAS